MPERMEPNQEDLTAAEKDFKKVFADMDKARSEAETDLHEAEEALLIVKLLLEKHPKVNGRMPLNEFMDFLMGLINKSEEEIRRNGGQEPDEVI